MTNPRNNGILIFSWLSRQKGWVELYEHLNNIKSLYGNDVSVQIPNDIFYILSRSISKNIQQISFAYAYIVLVSFLTKYAHYVDLDNGTYIQNADIKEFLGYNRTTKTIDYIIKKNGLLDQIGLTETTKNYPIRFFSNPQEKINNIPIREFIRKQNVETYDVNYNTIKSIVKNKNYEVKESIFLFRYNDDVGTLYEYANTHKVYLNELIKFTENDSLNNIDLIMYFYFKSKCQGERNKMKQLSLDIITSELGIGKDSFYNHLKAMEDMKFISVNHKGWTMTDEVESNEYYFKGIR